MSEDQKRKRILAAIAAVTMLGGTTPAVGSQSSRVDIEHKGRTITVSCNALDGHAQHADDAELKSIAGADKACRVQDEQRAKEAKKKAEQEQKKKFGATGFADAEHEANRQAAAELVQLLGDD